MLFLILSIICLLRNDCLVGIKDFLMFLSPLEQNVLVDRLCDLFA